MAGGLGGADWSCLGQAGSVHHFQFPPANPLQVPLLYMYIYLLDCG